MYRSARTRLAAISALALAAVSLTACGQSAANNASNGASGAPAEKDTLTFAAVPAESSTSLKSSFDNILALLEKETGKKVEFVESTDYAAVIEGQRAGQIDIASFGPFSYKVAKDGGVNVEAVAALVNKEGEKPAYTSLAYVKADSPIQKIEDLAGKKVCFVDAVSTSGYLVPSKGLMDVNIDPKTGVKPIMAGAHDASLLSVKSGQCDAGFAHDAMLATLTKSGQLQDGELRAVWESEPIPEDPIAVNRSTVDDATFEKVKNAMQNKATRPALVTEGICTAEADCVLPEEAEYGYVAVSDSDYDVIRELCDATKAEACNG